MRKLLTGGAGYALRTAFSSAETFQFSDMFIEAGANTLSGLISFCGGIFGGLSGTKVPGFKFNLSTKILNAAIYHIGIMTAFGGYPLKIYIALAKKQIKELY